MKMGLGIQKGLNSLTVQSCRGLSLRRFCGECCMTGILNNLSAGRNDQSTGNFGLDRH